MLKRLLRHYSGRQVRLGSVQKLSISALMVEANELGVQNLARRAPLEKPYAPISQTKAARRTEAAAEIVRPG